MPPPGSSAGAMSATAVVTAATAPIQLLQTEVNTAVDGEGVNILIKKNSPKIVDQINLTSSGSIKSGKLPARHVSL